MGYEFEHLSRVLMEAIYKVKNKESLLKIACALLKAKAAVLIEFSPENGSEDDRQIIARYPEDELGQIKNNPTLLWDWVQEAWLPEVKEGLIIEQKLQTEDLFFTGGLIVFGTKDLIFPGRQLAMVILQRGLGDQKPDFLSYHTWAVSNLLKPYESIRLAEYAKTAEEQRAYEKKRSVEESLQKKIYWQFASGKVIPFESWTDLNNRIKDVAPKDDPAIYHGVWIAFQIFRSLNQDKIDPGKWPPQDDCTEAFQYYSQNSPLPETEKGFDRIIRWVMSRCSNEALKGIDQIVELAEKAEMFSGIGEDRKLQPLKDQFACHLLCYLWLDILQQVRKTTNSRVGKEDEVTTDGKQTETGETSSFGQVSCLFFPQKKLPVSQLSDNAICLIRLTGKLFLEFLKSPRFTCKKTGMSDWGREALRLYLAIKLAGNSPRLFQLYLNEEKTLEHRQAPERLLRHFIQNLARFMISALMICLKRLDLDLEPEFRVVSPSEELDSLLYIIDQYAHVELGVDSRLNIRETLSRQITAEVHLHLTSPYYRDHLLHVIDVFLLGHLLLNTQVFWVNKEKHPMVEHLSKTITQEPNKDRWHRNWAVASLLHDIGYQLSTGRKLSTDLKVWERYFNLATKDGPKEFNFQEGIKAWESDQEPCKEFLGNLYQQIEKIGLLDKNSLPFSGEDHGMLSALRVSQVLLSADNQHRENKKTLSKDLIQAYALAIHAMACHNLHHVKVTMEKNPLGVILRLCDELQEWDRQRVNVEKVIKELYLDIQGNAGGNMQGQDLLKRFCANICIKASNSNGIFGPVELELQAPGADQKRPWFTFLLRYKDAITAQFDPSMTFLSKSYSFQHLDLSLDSQKQNEIRMMVELEFPVPRVYNGILEYDIYGLFTEVARDFPLLEQVAAIDQSPAGLVKLENKPDRYGNALAECFGIILQQKSEIRLGWLSVNPKYYRDTFITFKKKILSQMVSV